MKRVSVTYRIPQKAIDLLKTKYEVWVNENEKPLSKNELLKIASESDAIISLLSDQMSSEILEAGKGRLKIISNYAVGFNNIDVNKAKELGIRVTNTPDVLTQTTADLAWALMMAVARRVVESDIFLREGNFVGWRPELFLGNDIYGKTLGVIGFGRIGQAFAERAKGFRMKVLYNQRNRVSEDIEKDLNAQYADLEMVLKESDFISLHVPLTPETHYLLNKENMNLMKENAILVNTARGPVVDEKALYEMLKDNKIAGAGFDVFENEPDITEGLIDLKNVVLLPHIGTATFETRDKMAMMVANDIINVLEGKDPINIVV